MPHDSTLKGHPWQRPRRNRRTPAIRDLVAETHLHPCMLVQPFFLIDGRAKSLPIRSMPGIHRLSADRMLGACQRALDLGIRAVAVFPSIDDKLKDKRATESTRRSGLYLRTLELLKKKVPDLCLITDVAMDPYSSDGHDGLVGSHGEILNDETLPILGEMAVAQARAGADIVAPSDMMDGRVGFIRGALDAKGFKDIGILSYTAKYASSFYGPFREALSSAPRKGDKKTYQMDPRNVREALRELRLDIAEGADMVMVKPGLPYLDVIRRLADESPVPVAAYNVSGEYAMVKAAAAKGWVNERPAVLEILHSFRRAGADLILSYHAMDAAQWLSDKRI
ncbi:MAG: porphobilinogen synthase [Planctomycetota bacterium]